MSQVSTPKMRHAIAGKPKKRDYSLGKEHYCKAADTMLLEILKKRKINCMVIYVKIPKPAMWISPDTLAISLELQGETPSWVLGKIEPHLNRGEFESYETSLGGLIRGRYLPWKKHERDAPGGPRKIGRYIVVGTKQCQSCGQFKQAAQFIPSRLTGDGLSYRCRYCSTRCKRLSLQTPTDVKRRRVSAC